MSSYRNYWKCETNDVDETRCKLNSWSCEEFGIGLCPAEKI